MNFKNYYKKWIMKNKDNPNFNNVVSRTALKQLGL